jgi:hypothetical protein
MSARITITVVGQSSSDPDALAQKGKTQLQGGRVDYATASGEMDTKMIVHH